MCARPGRCLELTLLRVLGSNSHRVRFGCQHLSSLVLTLVTGRDPMDTSTDGSSGMCVALCSSSRNADPARAGSAAVGWVVAVDVGTGSARAAIFDTVTGRMAGRSERKIVLFNDRADFYEHSSRCD